MSDASQTFIHMCFALAGAGIVMWGAQQVCNDKMAYVKCVGAASGKDREKIIAACKKKNSPDGKKISTYIMYGGFGFIVGSVLILWLLGNNNY